jgi:hypothetical protein
MNHPPTHNTSKITGLNWLMNRQNALQNRIHKEISRFLKTMDELQLLKTVSKDLKNYKRMMQLRKYD